MSLVERSTKCVMYLWQLNRGKIKQFKNQSQYFLMIRMAIKTLTVWICLSMTLNLRQQAEQRKNVVK